MMAAHPWGKPHAEIAMRHSAIEALNLPSLNRRRHDHHGHHQGHDLGKTDPKAVSGSQVSASEEAQMKCYPGNGVLNSLESGGPAMEMRIFGRTGIRLSVLGFGCGAVGGLMVRGDPLNQERTIAQAIAAGVNYFDTAAQYGNGESEKNLGRILQKLKPPNMVVGTKVRLPSSDFHRIAEAIARSLESSLARLRLDRVDIFHLHNAVTETGGGESLSIRQVLEDVVPAFERLRQQGKTRFLGLTAIGDTAALHKVIDARAFDCAQVVYNMLNPSAATELAPNYPAQDYGRLFDHTRPGGVGVVAIRVLAGGALSGSAERHPIARPPPEPIGSAMSYDADLARARRLLPLVTEGFAASLTEAATRFALSHPAVGTILVGMATPQQFQDALAAVQKGPLAPTALDRLRALQQAFAGEMR
jgi:aryl-alcohol dehydrogenase-like predicted oxidoreductase